MFRRKRRTFSFLNMIFLLVIVLCSIFMGMIAGGLAMYTSLNKDGQISSEALSKVTSTYNKILNQYYGNIDEETLSTAAINGMTSILDDYTEFYDEGEAISFNNQVSGEYYGLGVRASANEEGIVIVEVLDDSPAKSAGLESGDVIISYNDKSLAGETAQTFTTMISKSTPNITLGIKRNNEEMKFEVTLKKIIIQSVSSTTFDKIGYIKIDIFASNTASQFKEELNKLESQDIKSLIIDVRNNTGGYLQQVSNILEMFVESGKPIYGFQTKDGNTMVYDTTTEKRDYKIVVLVNSYSASASEILAAGLKDSCGATLVGLKTFGKGSAQETETLSDGSMLKMTTKKWLTPSEVCIDGVGITPDYEINLDSNYNTNDYSTDNQLQKAIEVLKVS